MASVWDILGLSSTERTSRDVRRAYARLLKQHRPDQDPEGFRRIHDAYQAALRWAEDEDEEHADEPVHGAAPSAVSVTSSSDDHADGRPANATTSEASHEQRAGSVDASVFPPPTVEPEDPGVAAITTSALTGDGQDHVASETVDVRPIIPPAILLRSPWEVACEALDHVVAQVPGVEREQALVRTFRRLAELARERQAHTEQLIALLEWHVPGGRTLWRNIFTDDDLLAEVRCGISDLTAHTLRGCFEVGDWARLRTFAERWLHQDADELDHGDARALTRVLAVWLAPFDYALADRLVGYLPMRLRRTADHELDTLLAVGRELKTFPETSRAYLCALLAGHAPSGDEQLRWRTGALVSQLAPHVLARRMLEQRAAGHFAGLAAPSHAGNVNLLNVVFITVGMVLFTGWISLAVVMGQSNNWGDNLMWASVVSSVPGVFLLRWWYRKLLPRYQTSLRPWLWQHLGPFDGVLWFSLLYLWLGLGIPVIIQDVLPHAVEVAWILLMPFVGVVLIHHVRLRITKHRAQLPPWGLVLSSIQVLVREMSLKMTVLRALRWAVRVLVLLVGHLPALVGATICIGGLAWCRPFLIHNEAAAWLTAMFWSGPFVAVHITVNAMLITWWNRGRTPWWRPLTIFAWCLALPGMAWAAVLGDPLLRRLDSGDDGRIGVAVFLTLLIAAWYRERHKRPPGLS